MIYSMRYSSRQDRSIPLLLVYLGHRHALELSRHPHGTDFFLLYYCTQGKGEFTADGQRCVIQPGQAFLVWPHVPMSCRALTQDCTVELLGFTGPCCEPILTACGMEDSGVYQIRDSEVIPDYMERLVALHSSGGQQRDYSKLCYGLLTDLSSCIRKLAEVQKEEPASETIQLVLSYLENHYQEPVSLDSVAAEVGLTKEYLCVLFKKETKKTILQHLTLIRIGWARLFLEQYPEKKAYEIGKMCGFESPSYFGKKFREIVGLTPEQYRRVNSIVL